MIRNVKAKFKLNFGIFENAKIFSRVPEKILIQIKCVKTFIDEKLKTIKKVQVRNVLSMFDLSMFEVSYHRSCVTEANLIIRMITA